MDWIYIIKAQFRFVHRFFNKLDKDNRGQNYVSLQKQCKLVEKFGAI